MVSTLFKGKAKSLLIMTLSDDLNFSLLLKSVNLNTLKLSMIIAQIKKECPKVTKRTLEKLFI